MVQQKKRGIDKTALAFIAPALILYVLFIIVPVSYTHLTLPTKLEV